MKDNKFFVQVDNTLLARTDLTPTRKLLKAYLALRSNLDGWTFNATDIAAMLGISYKTACRELKALETINEITCIGYTKVLRHSYKKYVLTSDKMSQVDNMGQNVRSNLGQNVQTNFGQNVQTNFGQNVPLQELKKKELQREEIEKKKDTSTSSGNSVETTTHNQLAGSDSVGIPSTPLASPSVDFGSFFNDFAEPRPMYQDLGKVAPVWKPKTVTSSAVVPPSMPVSDDPMFRNQYMIDRMMND